MATLLAKGLTSKPRLLALQRESEALRGQRGQNIASIARIEQNIAEMKLQIINQKNDFATEIAGELKETRSRMNEYRERLGATKDVMQRTVITSPSEGIVTGLSVHTVGGVIEPGQPIMDIVPQDQPLVLEVRVQPMDIDVVSKGLPARVIFSAYKSRRMPLLTGSVTQVSADAFTDNQGLSYYTAKVEVSPDEISRVEMPIRLTPGMPTDVYIRTGSRSFLGYLLAPVMDSMHQAFREE